jgi:hypothetical protein
LAAWRGKDLSACVLSGDPECALAEGVPGDLPVAYLCGQQPHCRIVGDRAALAQAKANVEAFYPVVGILEELSMCDFIETDCSHLLPDKTLVVLEHKLPEFFSGAQELYWGSLHGASPLTATAQSRTGTSSGAGPRSPQRRGPSWAGGSPWRRSSTPGAGTASWRSIMIFNKVGLVSKVVAAQL